MWVTAMSHNWHGPQSWATTSMGHSSDPKQPSWPRVGAGGPHARMSWQKLQKLWYLHLNIARTPDRIVAVYNNTWPWMFKTCRIIFTLGLTDASHRAWLLPGWLRRHCLGVPTVVPRGQRLPGPDASGQADTLGSVPALQWPGTDPRYKVSLRKPSRIDAGRLPLSTVILRRHWTYHRIWSADTLSSIPDFDYVEDLNTAWKGSHKATEETTWGRCTQEIGSRDQSNYNLF